MSTKWLLLYHHHHSANGNNSTSANAAAAAAADGTFDGTARLLCSVSALTATRQQHQHYMCKCPHHCQHVHHHHHHQQDHQNDDDVRGNAAAAAVEAAVDQTQASESCRCLETASERRESEGERHIKIFKLPLFKNSVSKQCSLEESGTVAPGESKRSLASATVSTGSRFIHLAVWLYCLIFANCLIARVPLADR